MAEQDDEASASRTRLAPVDAWWQVHAQRAREWLAPQQPERAPTRGRRAWLLTMFTLRRWVIEDRGAGMAAILTIQTLLSTVPMISVALLIVGLMDYDSGSALVQSLASALVPDGDRSAAIAQSALVLAQNVTVTNLGWWGFVVVMSLAFTLFSSLEGTFNRIWRVTRKRSLLAKFTMFYTLATLGPALLLYSLAQPLVAGVTQMLTLPVLTTSLGLVLLNRFIPNTQVRWRPALVGGLVSAVLIELGKLGFGFYATRFALRTYEGVYGSLAMLPILVIWSYLSWMVILLGGQLTVTVQRRKVIALQHYLNRYVIDRTVMQSDSGRTAARLLLAVCDRYARHGASTHAEQLGARFGLPVDRVVEIVEELRRQRWLVEAEGETQSMLPARPLDQLRVLDVLVAFDREGAQLTRTDELGALFGQLDAARSAVLGEISFADLVALPRGGLPLQAARPLPGEAGDPKSDSTAPAAGDAARCNDH